MAANPAQETIVEIHGVPVKFPFPPYPTQLDFMFAVVESLATGKHSLLESPTGTGKTLGMLSAALAWQEYYASRTHAQLDQLFTEVKKSCYSPAVARLGSREQYCINGQIKELFAGRSGFSKICEACEYYKKTKRICEGFNNSSVHAYHSKDRNNPFLIFNDVSKDLEDSDAFSNKCQGYGLCPFYVSRELAIEHADLVLMPYSYLVDRDARQSSGIRLQNNVVLFDEGHNLPQLGTNTYQREFSVHGLEVAMSSLDWLGKEEEKMREAAAELIGVPTSDTPHQQPNWLTVKAVVLSFQAFISGTTLGATIGSDWKDDIAIGAATDLPNELRALCDAALRQHVMTAFELVVVHLRSRVSHGLAAKIIADVGAVVDCFHALSDFYYVIRVDQVAPSINGGGKQRARARGANRAQLVPERVFKWVTFSSSSTMRAVNDARALVVTSGTLSPFEFFELNVGATFPIKRSLPHVAPKQNFLLRVLRSYQKTPLNCSYRNRTSPSFMGALGAAITCLVRSVPSGGVLVFFPSFFFLSGCKKFWDSADTFATLNRSGVRFFCEESGKPLSSFAKPFQHAATRKSSSGGSAAPAVLFTVMRGRLSEGIDFKDSRCRLAVVVGLPFASWASPEVTLQMRHLDEKSGAGTGKRWYDHSMVSTVNQAIGRVLRHKRDWGAVVLLDERWSPYGSSSNHIRGISKWAAADMPDKYNCSPENVLNDVGDFMRFHVGQRLQAGLHQAESSDEEEGTRKRKEAVKPTVELPQKKISNLGSTAKMAARAHVRAGAFTDPGAGISLEDLLLGGVAPAQTLYRPPQQKSTETKSAASRFLASPPRSSAQADKQRKITFGLHGSGAAALPMKDPVREIPKDPPKPADTHTSVVILDGPGSTKRTPPTLVSRRMSFLKAARKLSFSKPQLDALKISVRAAAQQTAHATGEKLGTIIGSPGPGGGLLREKENGLWLMRFSATYDIQKDREAFLLACWDPFEPFPIGTPVRIQMWAGLADLRSLAKVLRVPWDRIVEAAHDEKAGFGSIQFPLGFGLHLVSDSASGSAIVQIGAEEVEPTTCDQCNVLLRLFAAFCSQCTRQRLLCVRCSKAHRNARHQVYPARFVK